MRPSGARRKGTRHEASEVAVRFLHEQVFKMLTSLTQRQARCAILKLLTETELEQVNAGDAARKLTAGEEYLDLELPLAGAQRSNEGAFPTGRILKRSVVDAQTWQQALLLVSSTASELENSNC